MDISYLQCVPLPYVAPPPLRMNDVGCPRHSICRIGGARYKDVNKTRHSKSCGFSHIWAYACMEACVVEHALPEFSSVAGLWPDICPPTRTQSKYVNAKCIAVVATFNRPCCMDAGQPDLPTPPMGAWRFPSPACEIQSKAIVARPAQHARHYRIGGKPVSLARRQSTLGNVLRPPPAPP